MQPARYKCPISVTSCIDTRNTTPKLLAWWLEDQWKPFELRPERGPDRKLHTVDHNSFRGWNIMRHIRTLKRRVRVLLFLTLLMGCGGSTGLTGPSSIFGLYQLVGVDGESLPAIVEETAEFKRELVSGFIRLNSDETFSQVLRIRDTSGEGVTTASLSSRGSFRREGNSFRFIFNMSVSDPTLGTLDGSTLTMDPGLGTVYRK